MKQLICIVILVYCVVCEGALETSKDEKKRINKRFNELDFPTCLENFDIHTDTIIRAQDSRAIGGRYINETEVTSREECLRLCCQTSLCDVFIFEEKSPGSCYLFDCGSSDDFKCKFNPHHHYTSGVMAVNRHVAELESQVRLSKHEEELAGLRKSAVVVHTTVPAASPTTTSTTTSITPSTPARPAAPASLPLVMATLSTSTGISGRHSRCSRYQFECRSSGECIAIYNACDGIPQCADGSDEGPELACPALPVPSTQPPLAPSPIAPKPAGQPEGPAQFPQFRQPPVWPPSSSWQQQPQKVSPEFNVQQTQPQAQQMQQAYNPQQQQQGAAEPHKFYGRDGVDYGGGAQWPAPQYRAPGVNNPAVAQPFHRPATYPAPEYQDPQNSHIFNHKGGSVLSGEIEGGGQYGGGYTGEAKQPPVSAPDYYPSYRQPPQVQWPPRPRLQQPQDHAPESVLGHSVEEELRAHAAHYGPAPQQQSPDYYSYEEGGATLHRHVHPPQAPPVKQEQQVQAKVQHRPPALMEGQAESVVTVETPRKVADPQPTAAPNPQPKEITTEHPLEVAHSKFHYSGEGSKKKSLASHPPPPLEPEPLQLPDGQAATPGGAYLSLSVGLTVTALLVVLISCRLRVVRRRLRRGGKSPYAHDADFLVNGMYL